MTSSVTIATIPGLGSISAGVTLPAAGLFAIEVDGTWTPAPLTLLATSDGINYFNVLDGGNEFVLASPSGVRSQLNAEDWQGITAVKVRSGTAEAPVIQAQDVNVYLIGYPAISPVPVPPNPGRTFTPLYDGDLGTFTEYTTGETGVLTFDVVNLLAPGVEIEALSSFVLQASADATPTARIQGAPGTSGTTLSVLLGNWQNIRYINYLVTVTFTTTNGATLQAQGSVAVQNRGPCC